MLHRFGLPDIEDPTTPLGASMRECEEYCVAACCGMNAFNVTVVHMQRWADTATAADVEQARREAETALESLASAPERFYYLDCEHSRSEVSEWFRKIRSVLAEVQTLI